MNALLQPLNSLRIIEEFSKSPISFLQIVYSSGGKHKPSRRVETRRIYVYDQIAIRFSNDGLASIKIRLCTPNSL